MVVDGADFGEERGQCSKLGINEGIEGGLSCTKVY